MHGCSLHHIWLQPPSRMVAASVTYGCRWEDEPFSRGVYSHVAVGASSADYDVMAEPPNPDPDPNLNPNPDPNLTPDPDPNLSPNPTPNPDH